MFGILANFLVVMCAKNLFGRLRPHAIHFCNASHYCPEGLNPLNTDFEYYWQLFRLLITGFDNKYIDEFECRPKYDGIHMRRNVRHSFYSGHASLAVYSGVYLILYLTRKLRPKSTLHKILLTIIYTAIAITSLYPGFTQWYNYWHFASDVFTGYAIGLLSSVVIFRTFTTESTVEEKKSDKYIQLNKLLTTAFLPINWKLF